MLIVAVVVWLLSWVAEVAVMSAVVAAPGAVPQLCSAVVSDGLG